MAPHGLPCSQTTRGRFHVITCCHFCEITLHDLQGAQWGLLVRLSLHWTDGCSDSGCSGCQEWGARGVLIRCASVPFLYRCLMCHDHVFDVLFHVFPLLILFWFVFGEGRYKHREIKYLRQMWDFTLESGKNYLCIRYVFEEPKTCIFDYSFPPKYYR